MSSDEEESNFNSEEEEEQSGEEQEEEDDESGSDSGSDEESGSGSDSDEKSGSGSDEESGSGSGSQEGSEQQQSKGESEDEKKLPTFKMVAREQPPAEFKFTSLLDEISSLGNSVDSFISTLHTSPTPTNYRAYTYQPRKYEEEKTQPPIAPPEVRVVKDEDCQVDMKPQIVIQPTKAVKEEPLVQAKSYQVSNESEKLLSQLYEQNRRLKRHQNSQGRSGQHFTGTGFGSFDPGSASMSRHMFGGSTQGFGGRDKFERKQYEKGLFNVDERNKQIDQAIQMLRREEEFD